MPDIGKDWCKLVIYWPGPWATSQPKPGQARAKWVAQSGLWPWLQFWQATLPSLGSGLCFARPFDLAFLAWAIGVATHCATWQGVWQYKRIRRVWQGIQRTREGYKVVNFVITQPGWLKPFAALQHFLDSCSGSSFYISDWTPIQALQSLFLFHITLITFTQPHFLNVLYPILLTDWPTIQWLMDKPLL